jgi:hypothetical protein
MANTESEMANEITLAFKVSDKMERAISKLMMETDRSKSEILRACVCFGFPTLKSNPSLIYRIDFSEFDINSN